MPGRILVIRGGAIGDFILTLPAIRLLRENFPDCHIEILGYRHIASLAERRYYADATRSIEYAPLATFFNPKGELDPGLCAYFAGFNQVISYIYDPDELFQTCLRRAGVKNLIAGSPQVGDGEHAATQLASPLDKLALWLEDPAARFYPSEEDLTAANDILVGLPGPYVAIHPGSGGEKKNWPLDRWVTVIEELLSGRHSGQVLIVGGEADTERLSSLHRFRSNPRCTFLQSLPLPVLGAVLSQCRLFLGHDSGISHLAAAAGARCLLLFGPTDPDVWAPANDGVEVLWAQDGQLSELEVEAVLGKLDEILPNAR
ncbi:glycosyltransferase family 9 protein [soil metagenome]